MKQDAEKAIDREDSPAPAEAETSGDPQWDIALSFRGEDEGLAEQLADLLGDRYRVFLYSREQETLTGPDGESRLMTIFEQARVVVVFYRKGWAERGWTYAEERAIRKRGHERRFEDYLFVVNVTDKASDLEWLPSNLIWWDLPRFGVEGAAAAVSSFAQRAGLKVRTESAAERAARLERKIQWEQERRAFLGSPEGTSLVKGEMEELFCLLEDQVASLTAEHTPTIMLFTERWHGRTLGIFGHGRTLAVSQEVHSGSVDRSRLHVGLYEGYAIPNRIQVYQPRLTGEMELHVDLIAPRRLRWSREGGTCFTTVQLADHLIKVLIDEIDLKRDL